MHIHRSRVAVRVAAASCLVLATTALTATPADAATAGTCTVKVTSIGRAAFPYVHSSITCNNAKSVRLETRLYGWSGSSWTLDSSYNSTQKQSWSSLDSTKNGSATQNEHYCSFRGVVDGYYTKGGVTYGKQAIRNWNDC